MDNSKRIAPEKTAIVALARPFQEFASRESSGGILLLACAIIALVWAKWVNYPTACWRNEIAHEVSQNQSVAKIQCPS